MNERNEHRDLNRVPADTNPDAPPPTPQRSDRPVRDNLAADLGERRLADTRAPGTEPQFRALFEQAATGMAVLDMSGRFVRANPFLCQLLACDETEVQRRHLVDLAYEDDRDVLAADLRRVSTGEKSWSAVEGRYVRKDGSVFWACVTISAVHGNGGAPAHLAIIVQDTTEAVRVATALRESEARYRRTVANTPGMVFQFVRYPDGSFEMPFASAGARELLGLEPETVQRESTALFDLVHPEDRAEWDRSVAASAAALSIWRWSGRAVLRTGQLRWIEGVSRPERMPDGRVVWDGLLIDVTDRHRAEEKIDESEQRFRSLFDHHPDGIIVLDPDGFLVSVNPACETLSGYRPDELVGQSFVPFVTPDYADAAMAFFREALEGAARTFPVAIRHKTGRRVEGDMTIVPMIVNGQVTGVFGIGRDLTAHRGLEAQLRQAQRMEAVGRLAGGVAHDFNNLLTVIQSCARFVAERVRGDPAARADVEQILNATARATELTRQLLAFGRQQVLQPRVIDLNAKVTRVAGMLRRVIGEDIALVTELDPELAPAVADPGQVEQVLMNLAVNARDAMPNGGTLWIRTSNVTLTGAAAAAHSGVTPGRYVSLEVEDTGTGIDPTVLPNIFDPFVTTKDASKGTGLGLATVYGIVKQSGGHIYADSSPGRGSRFTVLLPPADASGTAGATPMVQAIPRGNETILLVEDDAAVRSVARRTLETHGYRVIDAVDGEEALGIVDALGGRIDLMLLDIVMPGLNGRAVAEQLRTRWPNLRVIFMSGYTDDEIFRRGLSQPGLTFLPKPFTPDSLAIAVREALDAPRRP